MYRTSLITTIICISLSACKHINSKATAYIDEGIVIINDTSNIKKKICFDLSKHGKNLQIDKVQIKEITTVGEKAEKVYFLLSTDHKGKRRIAQYLFKVGNSFYLYKDLDFNKRRFYNNEPFYYTYFVCYGSDDSDCSPNIGIIENKKVWGSGTRMVCDLSGPCKTAQILVVDE